ncbi:MAG: toprim domain-containing protein [Hyphomicrobiales bacterium]|nr:toprim domain-containing protein [Hyphomicrobiales bacterium]
MFIAPSTGDKRVAQAREIWKQTIPAAGTLTDHYLSARGVKNCAIPPTIRHHPSLPYWFDGVTSRHPALVARVDDLVTGRFLGIQRIYLDKAIDADPAGKANVEFVKKTLGSIRGGGVLIGGKISPRHAVFVGEGIETVGNAVSDWGRPGIAALGTSGLKSLRLTDEARLIYILADEDDNDAGLNAAHEAADRWVNKERRRVRVVAPWSVL